MVAFKCFVVVLFSVSAVLAKHEQYDGHSLYEVTAENQKQANFVNQLETVYHVDIWNSPKPGRPGQVLVPGDKKEYFQNELTAAGIEFKVVVENIKEVLEYEDRLLETSHSRVDLNFTRILSFAEVEVYLWELQRAYPDLVTMETAGRSNEGRELWYLKISTTKFQDPSKPVVFMQSLLHAREWVTLPATLYAIHKLVVDVSEQELLQDIDWIIMPVANPDGYVFTHEDSRFWRKNRSRNFTGLCVGVDLNRNFDVDWGQASSSISCSDTFHGPSPFSEPETRAIRDIMEEHSERLSLFLDIHSFGSMILFGYGTGIFPPNALTVNFVGVQMAQAIDAVKADFNPNYIVGNVALVLYQASGSAMDYAKVAGAPLAYTYELPGMRLGVGAFGFLVDPAFIEQAGVETWEGIKEGARYARNNFRARNVNAYFGSMILFGYGTGVFPPNALTVNFVGVQMAQAIGAVKADFNPNYIVDNVALVLYQASGSAMDYAKVAGAPLAYTYELPGMRLGVGAFGFLVDPAFIEQAAMETWEGIKEGARYARNNFRARNVNS